MKQGLRLGLGALVWLSSALASASTELTLGEVKAVESTPRLVPVLTHGGALASSGTGLMALYVTNEVVLGRRLDAAGAPLDSPFVVTDSVATAKLELVFDGEAYVAVWAVQVDASYQIRARRLSVNGALLGSEQTLAIVPSFPVIAAAPGAGSVMVAYCLSSSGSCSQIQLDGDSVSTLPLAERGSLVSDLSVAFSGDRWMAVLGNGAGDYFAVRFDQDGPIDEELVELASGTLSKTSATVTGSADGFTTAWWQDDEVRLTSIALDGSKSQRSLELPFVEEALGLELRATPFGFTLLAVLPYSDTDQSATLYRLTEDGELSGNPVGIGAETSVYAFTAHDSDVVAAFTNRYGWLYEGRYSASSWSEGDVHLLSEGATDQSGALSAPGPDGWAVVWTENRGVYGQLLDTDGNPKGERADFCQNNPEDDPNPRALALAGGETGWFVVAECAPSDVVTFAWNAEGVRAPEPLLGASGRFKVVPRESGWLLATSGMPRGGGEVGLALARYTRSGSMFDSRTVPEAESVRGWEVDLTRTPDGFRLWWRDADKLRSQRLSELGDFVGKAETMYTAENLSTFRVATAFTQPDATSALWWLEGDAYHYSMLPVVTPGAAPAIDNGTELIAVGSVNALAGFRVETPDPLGEGLTELMIAEPDAGLEVKATLEATFGPRLSEAAADDRMMLTFERYEALFGSKRKRIQASIVEVDFDAAGGAGAGGEGGAVGGGEGGSAVAGGAGGNPSDGGVAQGLGGADEGGATAGTSSSKPARTSSSCGCEIPGRNDSHAAIVGVLGLALLTRRRKSVWVSS